MKVIYLLIACSVPLALGFLIAFLRSSKSGQFEDLETPAIRILFDDETNNQTHNEDNKA